MAIFQVSHSQHKIWVHQPHLFKPVKVPQGWKLSSLMPRGATWCSNDLEISQHFRYKRMDIYLWQDGDKIRALKKNPNNQPQKQYHNVKPEGKNNIHCPSQKLNPIPHLIHYIYTWTTHKHHKYTKQRILGWHNCNDKKIPLNIKQNSKFKSAKCIPISDKT